MNDDELRNAFQERQTHVDGTVDPHLAYRDFNEAAAPASRPWFSRMAVPAFVAVVALVVVGFAGYFNNGDSEDVTASESQTTPSAETPTPAVEPTAGPTPTGNVVITATPEPDEPTAVPEDATPAAQPEDPTPVPPTPVPPTPVPPTPVPPTPEPEVPTATPTPQSCSTSRYTVTLPAGWHTTTDFRPCQLFSPAQIILPGETEYVLEAGIYWNTQETFSQALNRMASTPDTWDIQSSSTTTVGGQPAQILEVVLGPNNPQSGSKQRIYVVDIGDGVLLATANEVTDNSQAPQNYSVALAGLDQIMASINLVVGQPPQPCNPGPPATWDQALGAITTVDFDNDGFTELIVPTETNAAGTNYSIFVLDQPNCTYVEIDGVNTHSAAATVSNFGCQTNADGTVQLVKYASSIDNAAATTVFNATMTFYELQGSGFVQINQLTGTNDNPGPPASMPPLASCQ